MKEDISLKIRQDVFKMAVRANGGHIAPAYSMADIAAVLFFDDVLRYNPRDPEWIDRDYFILSKGHGALALYSALSLAGYFDRRDLDSFCMPGSELGSLARMGHVPGVEATTGSLGHGLSFATGIALACKMDKKNNHIYVLLGDGECQEGSVWEAVMAAAHHGLDNMTVIIDYNKLQAMDSIDSIMSIRSFSERFAAFGFKTVDIDGHNLSEIKDALMMREENKPVAVIAHTIKGKGLSFMENVPIWHYRIPNEDEMEIALKELKLTREDLGSYEKCVFRNII